MTNKPIMRFWRDEQDKSKISVDFDILRITKEEGYALIRTVLEIYEKESGIKG